MSEMNLAITVRDVRKTFGRGWRKPAKTALNGVSIDVEAGETFGFIGPNGAGKSTLIKILVGALRPDAGDARLFGVDVGEPGARRGLGFVPENPSLHDHLTPCEILLMGLRLHGVRVANERAHCLHWLDRLNLLSVADTPLRGFSKGMQQRTALAHALAIGPRLLILDEPLSGLDPVGRKDVVDMLDEYRCGGGTLFFSSHVLYDVERIADRFGLIHQGQLVTIRSPGELARERSGRFRIVYCGSAGIAAGSEVRPGWHELEADEGDIPRRLQEIAAAGGQLHEVRPLVSLESVFFQHIRAAPQ